MKTIKFFQNVGRVSFFRTILFAAVLSNLLLFSGCKAYDDASNFTSPTSEYSPEFAAPIINTQLSLKDILKLTGNLSFVQVESDGQIKLVYEGKTQNILATSIVAFPPTIPFAAPSSNNSIPFQAIGGINVRNVSIKSGTISYGFSASETLIVTVTIPELSKNGVSFKQTNAVASGSFKSAPFDLSGYTFSPNANKFSINYEAKKSDGSLVNNLNLQGNFNDIKYTYIDGYMTSQFYNFEKQRTYFNLFTELLADSLVFVDPKAIVTIDNSFGLPIAATVNSMNAFVIKSTGFIDTLPLIYQKNSIDVSYPLISEIGKSKTSKYVFDKTNSNISLLINKNPLLIEYDIDAKSKDSGTNVVFLNENSSLQIKTNFELPMYLKAKNFYYEQKIKPDLSILDGTVENAELKIISNNNIPTTVGMQVYFNDRNGNILDTLFANGSKKFLEAASVDANGNVTTSGKTEFLVPLDKAKVNRIKGAKEIVLGFVLSTTNNGKTAVRMNSNQNIDIRMGIKVKTKL